MFQGVHGTKAEEELTDGRLLMCLIVMLKVFDHGEEYLSHPFGVKGFKHYILYKHYYHDKYQKILNKMQSNVGQVRLLNYRCAYE